MRRNLCKGFVSVIINFGDLGGYRFVWDAKLI